MMNPLREYCSSQANDCLQYVFPNDVFSLDIANIPVAKEIRDKWSNAGGDRYNDHVTRVHAALSTSTDSARRFRGKVLRSRGQHLRQCPYQKQCSNPLWSISLPCKFNDNTEIKCSHATCRFSIIYVDLRT